jgi:hypothetical protein
VSCVNWNPIHDVGCGVKGVVGGVATSVFDDVAQDFAHLAEHATAWVWSQLDTATAVRLSGASWDGVLQVTVELGVLVCVTMFLLQIIFSALRQEPGGMGRAVRGVMIAMIGMFAAFIITDSLLALVDSLSDGVMQALAGTTSWNALGSKVIHSNTLTSGAIGSAGMLVGALILLISSIVVWLALMVRKMLVIISAAFAPIAFGGAPFDVTSAWVRRWIEFTIAMVFSKLILVILFGIGLQIELGLGQVGTATTQEITQMATGLLVMSVAGFAPWLALQFVHWAGGSLQQAGQHARSAGAGAQQAIAVPQRMYAGGRVVGSAAAAGAGAAAAGAGGLAVAAGRLAGGGSRGNGNGSSSSGGSNGSSGGPDAGDKVSGAASSRAGTAGAASGTAYEAGKNQTGQALGAEGGAVSGGQERQQGTGQQGTGSQSGGGSAERGGQDPGKPPDPSSGTGDGGAGAGGPPSRGGSVSGEPSGPGGSSGSSRPGSSPGQESAPNPSQRGRPTGPGQGGPATGGGGDQGKTSGGGLGGEPTGPGGATPGV